jgi:putative component of membrane protein insertase Oxa1/YidC/SpoIIIJ protein YidD
MLKKIAIILISLYQATLSPLTKQMLGIKKICRFDPSCSVYAKNSIEKYGLIKGTKMGIIRIWHCRP